MSHLFDSYTIRKITLKNRIGISPMCEYSAENGLPNNWHLVHLGSRAVGGAGLVIAEATSIEPIGCISPGDTGMWSDEHIKAWATITEFVSTHGAVPGIQIAHAGRKAGTRVPWEGGNGISDADGGWQPVAPSSIPFSSSYRQPKELTIDEIHTVQSKFMDAAKRAFVAGFRWLEIHGAHGYLVHSFLSPLTNKRSDLYGGSFENRTRFLLETAEKVRSVWPDDLPLAVRLSCTDWVDDGWDIEQSIALARLLKDIGVDLIDCSSGGIAEGIRIHAVPGYQVSFAERIRREAGIATAAVGMITEPDQADSVITDGQADIVLIGRQSLRDPYWPLHAADALGKKHAVKPPVQYERVF